MRGGFGKNAGKWTGRVEICKEEIPGSKRSMYLRRWSDAAHPRCSFFLFLLSPVTDLIFDYPTDTIYLKGRYLIRQNRTKRANFRGSPLFQATYKKQNKAKTNNRKTNM